MAEPTADQPRKLTTHATVFAFVFIAMLLSTLLPLRQYQASKGELRALLAKEASIDAQTAQLGRERQRLSSDGEVERLAREHLNMVRPGEIAFAIAGAVPEMAAVAPARAGKAHQKAHRSWYKAFWHWVWGG